jgi:High potential iron-sulfur protein
LSTRSEAFMKNHRSGCGGLTRRMAVKSIGLAAGISIALPWKRVHGAEPARLDEKDPAAVALDYVSNAAGIDGTKHPGFVPGSTCENCLQLQGSAGNNYRPCSLFPGKLVSVSGWCKGWTAEM